MTTSKKTIKLITSTLTALALCLAAGCGGVEERDPRPPQLVELDTGKVFAKYDDTQDTYWVLGYKTQIPAEVILPIVNGRVGVDTDIPTLADDERPLKRLTE